MRRFLILFVLLPLAIVVVVFCRSPTAAGVTFSLDPFGAGSPALVG